MDLVKSIIISRRFIKVKLLDQIEFFKKKLGIFQIKFFLTLKFDGQTFMFYLKIQQQQETELFWCKFKIWTESYDKDAWGCPWTNKSDSNCPMAQCLQIIELQLASHWDVDKPTQYHISEPYSTTLIKATVTSRILSPSFWL